MKTPPGLQPLIDDGVIDEVLRSLKSGKEATFTCALRANPLREGLSNMAQRSFQKRRSTRKDAPCAAAGNRAQ
jgi:RIO kinase 1